MSTKPTVSVVVETENLATAGQDRLAASLASLRGQAGFDEVSEVLVVESAPDDEDLTELPPGCRRLRAPAGAGYEGAKLFGAQHARGELVVFADADCRYQPGWLRALLAPLVEGRADVVAGFTRLEVASPRDLAAAATFCLPVAPDERKAGGWFLWNNLALRRGLVDEVPYPEPAGVFRFPDLWADALRAAGAQIVFSPEARALHAAPRSAQDYWWRYVLLGNDRARARPTTGAGASVAAERMSLLRFRLRRLRREGSAGVGDLAAASPWIAIGWLASGVGYALGRTSSTILPRVVPEAARRQSAAFDRSAPR